MSKKGRQVFHEKNTGVTPSVAAPGVTHPSDATESLSLLLSLVCDETNTGKITGIVLIGLIV